MMNGDVQNKNETHVNSQYFIDMWKRNKLFTDDYMKLINNHWLEFMPPNSNFYYIWGTLFTIVMILGCIGNLVAIIILLKFNSLEKSTKILMLNLAISDLISLTNTTVIIYNTYYLGPALGNLGCQIDGLISSLTGIVSTMTLTAISVDRYNGIVHPLKSLRKYTKNKTRIWISTMWIYGFLLSVIQLSGFDYGFTPEGILINCTSNYLSKEVIYKWIMVIFYITGVWFLPSMIVFYCYINISIAVNTSSEVSNSRIGQDAMKKKTKIIFGIMAMSTIVLYTFSITPHTIVVILGVLDKKEFITPILTTLSSFSSKVCSCVNPWVYIILPRNSRTKVWT